MFIPEAFKKLNKMLESGVNACVTSKEAYRFASFWRGFCLESEHQNRKVYIFYLIIKKRFPLLPLAKTTENRFFSHSEWNVQSEYLWAAFLPILRRRILQISLARSARCLLCIFRGVCLCFIHLTWYRKWSVQGILLFDDHERKSESRTLHQAAKQNKVEQLCAEYRNRQARL